MCTMPYYPIYALLSFGSKSGHSHLQEAQKYKLEGKRWVFWKTGHPQEIT